MRPPTLFAALALIGCTAAHDPLPLFGGYRSADDPCQRVAEDAFTNQFLDDSRDLVACPMGYDGTEAFLSETGATEVGRKGAYILYSAPL